MKTNNLKWLERGRKTTEIMKPGEDSEIAPCSYWQTVDTCSHCAALQQFMQAM